MNSPELTILMPCLNESETLATCIRKARDFLQHNSVDGEILIADNGSTDGSIDIATTEGARVVKIEPRGYGAALSGGIAAARGKYIVMGDADDSYDFYQLMPFLQKLRAGADLVMGNRFRGGIEHGAMPLLHKYLGNPVLSWLGRLFFDIKIGDFHCGLRGFNRNSINELDLRTTGMEFASEMVVRSALVDYRIEEVPTTLRPDGRTRRPHLRTWRDGARHLGFLLMFSPRWLFLYPGLALLTTGIVVITLLFQGVVTIKGVGFDIHTYVAGCFFLLLGSQAISFSIVARRFATSHKLLPESERFSNMLDALTFERIILAALIVGLLGIAGLFWSFSTWASTGFGPLEYPALLRFFILSMTFVAISVQSAFLAFLSAITEVPTR